MPCHELVLTSMAFEETWLPPSLSPSVLKAAPSLSLSFSLPFSPRLSSNPPAGSRLLPTPNLSTRKNSRMLDPEPRNWFPKRSVSSPGSHHVCEYQKQTRHP